ncbi:DUF3331 domain-containing protein [Caballeronia sp. INML2]|uniref:DUF3331 domain-containing protein n=1 Tax=Caballeronia sp. INML2 TaxID=2921748 RepID=UPI003905F2DA
MRASSKAAARLRCCYGDQTWRAMRARTADVCAMSGCAISPGDVVYWPNLRPVPSNAGAMILASVLDHRARVKRGTIAHVSGRRYGRRRSFPIRRRGPCTAR